MYLEPSQTSKMDLFAKIVNVFQPLTIFAESFILDVRLGSAYASVVSLCIFLLEKRGLDKCESHLNF